MSPMLNEIEVSPCETHHIWKGVPLYFSRFHKVLKYHEPGLAPAYDESGAFHINLSGKPAYATRFVETFGFYCGYAAVCAEQGWGHITPKGRFLYLEKYDWCGNFQEDRCSVRDKDGNYFHIDAGGGRLYPDNYAYVGDFKDGIAVVCNQSGRSSHIDSRGLLIHGVWYDRLDVFHKGFARARDARGWFHLTKEGLPAYGHHFADLEPFYNGQAFAQTLEGDLVIINSKGQVVKEVSIRKSF